MHTCSSNFRALAVSQRSYAPIFPALLKVDFDQIAFEFASREMSEIGLLRTIADAGKSIAVGLVDVKNLWIKPVPMVSDRI